MCAEDGLMPKFDAGNTREFVYWAVTMLLRATLITTELGNNFLLEIICALLMPMITIFGRAFTLKGNQNTFHALAPILASMIALVAFFAVKKVWKGKMAQ